MNNKSEDCYKDIAGSYDYGDFILHMDHVPDKPGLRTSRFRATMPLKTAKFPKDVFVPKSREIAARDFITRKFFAEIARFSLKPAGLTGGKFYIDKSGRELLETSAVVLGESSIEIRFAADMPLKRLRIDADIAIDFFSKRIPGIVRESLKFETQDGNSLVRWIETTEDADFMRDRLAESGLVAYIADGSYLSGIPAEGRRDLSEFVSPDELAFKFELPNKGEIRGMGIPSGITLIIGNYRQGKSTFLRAVELGVYNRIPGDGREFVVTVPDAMGIRTEPGRSVEQVDVSLFFNSSGRKDEPSRFSSRYTLSAESMAANLMEALEIGTSLLLFDDETTSNVLLGEDSNIQTLAGSDKKLATLYDLLPVLRDVHGISSILVNPPGDYFDIADTVIVMKDYIPQVATEKAMKIAKMHPFGRNKTDLTNFSLPEGRRPLTPSLEPLKLEEFEQSKLRSTVQYGDEFIDVTNIPQIISQSQARAISRGISMVYKLMDGSKSLKDAVSKVMQRVDEVGLDSLSSRLMGDLAKFRAQDLAAAINRKKDLKVK